MLFIKMVTMISRPTHLTLQYDSVIFSIKRLISVSLNLSWTCDRHWSIKCSVDDAIALQNLGPRGPRCWCFSFTGQHEEALSLSCCATWRRTSSLPAAQPSARLMNEAMWQFRSMSLLTWQTDCNAAVSPANHVQPKRAVPAETCPSCQSTQI